MSSYVGKYVHVPGSSGDIFRMGQLTVSVVYGLPRCSCKETYIALFILLVVERAVTMLYKVCGARRFLAARLSGAAISQLALVVAPKAPLH